MFKDIFLKQGMLEELESVVSNCWAPSTKQNRFGGLRFRA